MCIDCYRRVKPKRPVSLPTTTTTHVSPTATLSTVTVTSSGGEARLSMLLGTCAYGSMRVPCVCSYCSCTYVRMYELVLPIIKLMIYCAFTIHTMHTILYYIIYSYCIV